MCCATAGGDIFLLLLYYLFREKVKFETLLLLLQRERKRMGRGYNKQYILLADKPIVAHTIEVFENMDLIDEIILVVGRGETDLAKKDIIYKYNLKKVVKIVEGGTERQDSVYNGLKAIDGNCNIVLIHDGARPFVTDSIIEKSIKAAGDMGACVVAVRVKDTIKVGNKNMEVDYTG